jgi:hypothetical protein
MKLKDSCSKSQATHTTGPADWLGLIFCRLPPDLVSTPSTNPAEDTSSTNDILRAPILCRKVLSKIVLGDTATATEALGDTATATEALGGFWQSSAKRVALDFFIV